MNGPVLKLVHRVFFMWKAWILEHLMKKKIYLVSPMNNRFTYSACCNAYALHAYNPEGHSS